MPADVKIKAAISRCAGRPSLRRRLAVKPYAILDGFAPSFYNPVANLKRPPDSVRVLASYPPPLQTRLCMLRGLILENWASYENCVNNILLKRQVMTVLRLTINLVIESWHMPEKKWTEETRISFTINKSNRRFIRFTIGPTLPLWIERLKTRGHLMVSLCAYNNMVNWTEYSRCLASQQVHYSNYDMAVSRRDRVKFRIFFWTLRWATITL